MRQIITTLILSVMLLSSVALVASASGEIYYAEVEASINPITKDYILRVLDQAANNDASLIIFRLDTPGGLVTSTREIVEAIFESDIPVVVYVGPSGAWAASAGTFITMSADVAVMARGAAIGAAHPVGLTGSAGSSSDPSTQKSVNFLSEWAREIALERGRNPDFAEQAVRTSQTLGWEEAINQNAIDLAVDDFDGLIDQLNGHQLSDGSTLSVSATNILEMPMSFRENSLNMLADPNLVYILLLVGIFALVLEFATGGGIGIGLIIGGTSLLIAFMGLQILPVSYAGLGLLIFGALLVLLDVYYTPTNGILTLGGIVSLLVGSFTLFQFEAIDPNAIRLAWWTVALSVGFIAAFFMFIVTQGILSQTKQPTMGREAMVGLTGYVKDTLELEGEGIVYVRGEYWRAVPVEDEIAEGEEIEVVGIEEGRLYVRRHLGQMAQSV